MSQAANRAKFDEDDDDFNSFRGIAWRGGTDTQTTAHRHGLVYMLTFENQKKIGGGVDGGARALAV